MNESALQSSIPEGKFCRAEQARIVATLRPHNLDAARRYREGAFEDEAIATDLRFAARALERAIRAWLDLPKI